jgi:hypothetical protein
MTTLPGPVCRRRLKQVRPQRTPIAVRAESIQRGENPGQDGMPDSTADTSRPVLGEIPPKTARADGPQPLLLSLHWPLAVDQIT